MTPIPRSMLCLADHGDAKDDAINERDADKANVDDGGDAGDGVRACMAEVQLTIHTIRSTELGRAMAATRERVALLSMWMTIPPTQKQGA